VIRKPQNLNGDRLNRDKHPILRGKRKMPPAQVKLIKIRQQLMEIRPSKKMTPKEEEKPV